MNWAPRLCGAFAAFSLLCVTRADTCEIICIRESIDSALYSYRYILAGRVIDVRWNGPEGSFAIQPVRVWKGKWQGDRKRFRVTTHGGSASCGYPLVHGAYYVIFASDEPQRVGLCDHEPLPLYAATKEVAELDRARHRSPLNVPEEALVPPWKRK